MFLLPMLVLAMCVYINLIQFCKQCLNHTANSLGIYVAQDKVFLFWPDITERISYFCEINPTIWQCRLYLTIEFYYWWTGTPKIMSFITIASYIFLFCLFYVLLNVIKQKSQLEQQFKVYIKQSFVIFFLPNGKSPLKQSPLNTIAASITSLCKQRVEIMMLVLPNKLSWGLYHQVNYQLSICLLFYTVYLFC